MGALGVLHLWRCSIELRISGNSCSLSSPIEHELNGREERGNCDLACNFPSFHGQQKGLRQVLQEVPDRVVLLLRNIDPFNFENHRSRPIRTTRNHCVLFLHPTFHNRTALQTRVDVPWDCIPSFRTKGLIWTTRYLLRIPLCWN